MLKKTHKRNLERNIKHMIIVSDFNHFNTVIYTKCLVTSFLQSKQLFNYFMRESVKKTLKTLITQLSTYFQAYDYFLGF